MYSLENRAKLYLKSVKQQPGILKRLEKVLDDEDWMAILLNFQRGLYQPNPSNPSLTVLGGTLTNFWAEILAGFTLKKSALNLYNTQFEITFSLTNRTFMSNHQLYVGLSSIPGTLTTDPAANSFYLVFSGLTSDSASIQGTGALPYNVTTANENYRNPISYYSIGKDASTFYVKFGDKRVNVTAPSITGTGLYFMWGYNIITATTTVSATINIFA